VLLEVGGGFPRRLNATERPIAHQVPRGKGEKNSEKRVKSARNCQRGSVREEILSCAVMFGPVVGTFRGSLGADRCRAMRAVRRERMAGYLGSRSFVNLLVGFSDWPALGFKLWPQSASNEGYGRAIEGAGSGGSRLEPGNLRGAREPSGHFPPSSARPWHARNLDLSRAARLETRTEELYRAASRRDR